MDETTVNAEVEEVVTPQNLDSEESTEAIESSEVSESEQEESQPSQTPEENAQFAKVRREAEQKARDKARDELIAEMYGDQGIQTYADYQRVIAEQKEAERLEQLEERIKMENPSLSDEDRAELITAKNIIEKYQKEEQEKAEKEKVEKDRLDFIEWHKTAKGTEPIPETIPKEVWLKTEQGLSLKQAFIEYDYNQLHEKVKEYEKLNETQVANEETANASSGSVKSSGSPQVFISQEVFDANKGNPQWVKENYLQIMKDKTKWKG